MNYCPFNNFWLLINTTDPLGQLAWLADTLQQSENENEKVHIIGHIHPSSCMLSWSVNYYRIVNRYESTIAGQFFGHTHNDEFELFYDLSDRKRAVSIAYLAGSVTTFTGLNPAYRIYTVDGSYDDASWQVLDHETYIMNLTDANLNVNREPVWQLEYTARKAYNMTSIYAQDWSNLIDQALADLNGPLVDKMLAFYSKSSDIKNSNCDKVCRKKFLCKFKQARSDYFIPC